MKKEQKDLQRLARLGILTLVTALIWVALDGYHQLIAKEKFDEVNHLLQVLDPQLDTTVISEIQQRREYQMEDVDRYIVPEPTITEEVPATPSGQPTITEPE